MKYFFLVLISLFLFTSCSTKNQLIYLKDIKKHEANSWAEFSVIENRIESNDILKIEISTVVPEASLPYNKLNSSNNTTLNSIEFLKLQGYVVDNKMMINFFCMFFTSF